MTFEDIHLPYFDLLLAQLEQENTKLELAFGRHVHWGYWSEPPQGVVSPEDFAQAAENLTKKIYFAANTKNNQRILDVGCGFGGTIASLNENFSGMELIGLNIDIRQLLRAQEKVKAHSGNTIYFEAGDACALPFPDQSFDVVLAVECIFHFPERSKFFAEAWRVLKPGGYFALSDFIPQNFFSPLTAFSSGWPFARGFFGRCNLQYTLAQYRSLAQAMGFKGRIEKDITENTLPTYSFLRALGGELGIKDLSAKVETGIAEWTSRLGLLRYRILSFEKLKSK
ncbi:class I SAM-dependent methyltransferase [Nitrosococcus watsonii]|uniref:Methyltransferase type 11 n=1 Tax=Nitrosococcus watsoni (strain C-113) TaxID=105559 RepID=D8K7J7_NITWC|nr:class I SAM-dependent methyltransferase [Nitrosococcus watsonii]ADJ28874.1 Methyltransferase type 11 [Nitrosococcus watsonii C-113]